MGLFGNTLSASNHDSPIGAIGGDIQKWTDPIAWIPGVGDKWVNLTSNEIPKWTNEALSPVARIGGKIDQTVNPVRRIPAVNNVMSTVEAKPADAAGLAIGSYFAAPAVAGAFGSGAGGGAAGDLSGVTGSGDALGSFSGLTGQSGAVMGGGGAINSVAPDVAAGSSDALGSTAGMTGDWLPVQGGGSSPLLNSKQAQLLSQALSNFGNRNNNAKASQVQIGAANAAPAQASISAGPVVPAIRNQMMAQALMRGY